MFIELNKVVSDKSFDGKRIRIVAKRIARERDLSLGDAFLFMLNDVLARKSVVLSSAR